MSSNELRGADVVARRLVDAGCAHAFGIPGGEVLTLVDALEKAGIRFVLVRHENSGGFMAEGTYHATGAPGLVVATVGPGVANLTNVVANAQQDRVPLIVLTGCLDPALTPTFTHQVFDHQAVLRPLCKASFRLEPRAEAAIIDKAVAIAIDGRPGPVHVDVPMSVADAPATLRRWHPRGRPARASEEALSDARVLLDGATKPVVLIGNDVLVQDGESKVRALVGRSGAPAITTYKAKGVIDESSPQCLGAAGLSPKADAILLPLVKAADVALLVGYDPIEMRAGWRDPFSSECAVIELTAVPDTQFVHHATMQLVGEVGANLEGLLAGVSFTELWPDDEPTRVREAVLAAYRDDEVERLTARSVTAVLAELPSGARVTVDTGAHRILASQMMRRSLPGLMHQSTGLCTMGCALPLAIGASLADPHRPTVALVGDGGFEMVIGELATARDLGVDLTVVVYDDRSLALIEKKQRARGLKNVGVDFGSDETFEGTDYDSIARGFGARGVTVSDLQSFRAELKGAIERDGIDVITCRIPRRDYDDAI